jgi:hypothetical protein
MAYRKEFDMDFAEFKVSEPARAIFRKLGLEGYLYEANSWRMLRILIVHFNDPDEGRFVERARRCNGVCSSGERILLHAICYVCDFAWLADELGGKGHTKNGVWVWRNMDRVSGVWRRAVAACIAAEV